MMTNCFHTYGHATLKLQSSKVLCVRGTKFSDSLGFMYFSYPYAQDLSLAQGWKSVFYHSAQAHVHLSVSKPRMTQNICLNPSVFRPTVDFVSLYTRAAKNNQKPPSSYIFVIFHRKITRLVCSF